MTHIECEIGAIVLEMVGVCLLFSEVWKAQQLERLTGELSAINRQMAKAVAMSELLRTDPREFWLQTEMDMLKASRAEVEEMAKIRGDAGIRDDIEPHRELWERGVVEGAKRLETKTTRFEERVAPRVLDQRKWLLLCGFLCLMLGAGLHLTIL